MDKEFEKVNRLIDGYRNTIVKSMSEMIPIKAISPTSGGEGESKRADFLQKVLESWGFEVKRYDYKDTYSKIRSSLVVVFGSKERTVWFVAHIDTVSEGDISLWNTDPFKAVVKEDKIYGRGTNDNGQEVIAMMYALRALKESKSELKYNFGLILAADEEVGSTWGAKKLLDEGIFKKEDMVVVSDFGRSQGDEIEIAEKGILWIRITVNGKQVHASTPDKGKNAYRYSIKYLAILDELLHRKYNKKDKLLGISTFEMTKHEKNVDSINIVPGREVLYIDCRVIPEYSLDDVIGDMKDVAKSEEFTSHGVKIDVEIFERMDAAPKTSEDAEVVKLLVNAIGELRGIKTKMIGVGGGTIAGFFRKRGFPAVVWSTQDDVAHQANEYVRVDNMIDDAKVFAYMLL